jgi:coenzyme F420 hydrogenase subunit beta
MKNATMIFQRIDQVVEWRLCLGCGACAAVCTEKGIAMTDIVDQGLRPVVNFSKCRKCGECIKVCPGIELSHTPFSQGTIPELRQAWGPVLEVWEGWASDTEIRFKGSSGGVATALALYCLEKEGFSGVLHTGVKPDAPLQNATVCSRNRNELLACAGSRYSPAAPCEILNSILESESRIAFIGKPCDVVGVRKYHEVRHVPDGKVGLAISIFCAGTPATMGTYKVLETLGVERETVDQIRYRGCGWPGMTSVRVKGVEHAYEMTYEKSWGSILNKNIQVRCRLCPDGTGEFADISCGDPWYREIKPDEPGRSLVLVRTERGGMILRKAIQAGYIKLEEVSPDVLAASQKSLLNRRQHLFGRLLAMRIMGVPTPHFTECSLYSNWSNLPLGQKIRSVAGTFKRIIQRKWTKPVKTW